MAQQKKTPSPPKPKHLSNGKDLGDFCSDLLEKSELDSDFEAVLAAMNEVDGELPRIAIDYSDKSAAEQLGIHLCKNPEIFKRAMSPNWAQLLRKPSAANWGAFLGQQALTTPNPALWLQSLADQGLVFFSTDEDSPSSDWHSLAKAENSKAIDWMLARARTELGGNSKAYAIQSGGAIARAIKHGNDSLWAWANQAVLEAPATYANSDVMMACIENGKPHALSLLMHLVPLASKPTKAQASRIAFEACTADDPMKAIQALGTWIDWKENSKIDNPIAFACMRSTLTPSAIDAIEFFKSMGIDARDASSEQASTAAVAALHLPFDQAQSVLALEGADYLTPCARSHFQGENRLDAISYAIDHIRSDESFDQQNRLRPFFNAAILALKQKGNDNKSKNNKSPHTLSNWAQRCANEGLPDLFEIVAMAYQEMTGHSLPPETMSGASSSTPMGEDTERGRRACFAKAAALGMNLDQTWDTKWTANACVAKSTIQGIIDCDADGHYRQLLSERLYALASIGVEIAKHCPTENRDLPEIQQAIAMQEAVMIRKEIAKDSPMAKSTRKHSV